jgi:hypothetical protein
LLCCHREQPQLVGKQPHILCGETTGPSLAWDKDPEPQFSAARVHRASQCLCPVACVTCVFCGITVNISWVVYCLCCMGFFCFDLILRNTLNDYLLTLCVFLLFLFRLLYSLAFNARFLRHLWFLISSMTTRMITGYVWCRLKNWAHRILNTTYTCAM